MHALAPNACTMLHPRALALQRPALCRRFNTCLNVATCRPKVLQSLDLHAAEESEVEGLGIIPQSWGTPAGRLLSQGEHVCDLDALKHLGISCEAGPIVLGRDHFHAALLSTVFSKLQRHHVGSWLLEAARQPEAAAVFEAHAELEAWLVQLAEKRFGKDRSLLVQQDSPAAAEAASQLQTLSACFGKELHSIPVAFTHDTAAAARQLLLAWLLELPDAAQAESPEGSPEGQARGPEAGPEGLRGAGSSTVCSASAAAAAAAAAAVGPARTPEGSLTASQHQIWSVLQAALGLLPYKPSLFVKELPAADAAGFSSRVQSTVPAAAALAAAASRRAVRAGAAACAVAAGWVDGRACVCVTTEVLGRDVNSAAFVVLAEAMQGLGLRSRQCTAAFEAVATASAPAAASMLLDTAVLRSSTEEKLQMVLDKRECLAAMSVNKAEAVAEIAAVVQEEEVA